MSNGTESRLGELLGGLPEPTEDVTERALARALSALPESGRRRAEQPVMAFALVLAASFLLLAVAAGALAAAGALHVGFGRSGRHPQGAAASSTSQLSVPQGAAGIAATVDGRLWLTTSGGLRLQGLPVSAAALSPHALYVAAGVGNALVALAPDGRRAWSHPTPGPVASIGWAPDGLRIAYVVRVGSRFRLYAIEGNGRNDRLVDAGVRPVRPAWRADSLAFAYVAAGGRPAVYDFGHASHTVAAALRGAVFLAFAPSGDRLAVATVHRVALAGEATTARYRNAVVAGLAWAGGRLAVGLDPRAGTPHVSLLDAALTEVGRRNAPGRIGALDVSAGRMAIAAAGRGGVRLLAAPATAGASQWTTLLRLPAGMRVGGLALR